MVLVLLLALTAVLLKDVACLSKNPYCGLFCDDGRGNKEVHTVCERDKYGCGPDPKCGPHFQIVRLNDKQRQKILNIHNGLRCRITLGKERRGNQPPARNMQVMNYDMELEFISQCWANACNGASLIHDRCRRTKQYEHVGQNLGYVNSSLDNINFTSAMHLLIRYWYDEVAIFKNQWVSDTRDRGPNVKVGHYTQMMWADTHSVGCAGARYRVFYGKKVSYEFLFVCNYAPGGNYIGSPVYQAGKPGTACPGSLTSNNKCRMCGLFQNVSSSEDDFISFLKF